MNHLKKNFSLTLFAISFLFGIIFLISFQQKNPHISELSFIEKSNHALGSVIPASCNSLPPTSHFMNDCTTTCWNGAVYDPYLNSGACPPMPSGTLTTTGTTCTVPNGGATCDKDFTWTTSNPIGLSQVVGDGGGPFSSAVNNNTETLAVKYIDGVSAHVFRLYNNASELASRSVTADCASSSAWNGSSCQACSNGGCTNHVCNNSAGDAPTCTPPAIIGTFTATPSTVASGDTSNLAWTGVSGATSCTLNGGQFSAVSVGTAATGNQTTTGITSTTPYTLTCTNQSGVNTQSTATVTVVDPQVSGFSITGNNTPSGIFTLSCTGSTQYDILKDGISVYGGPQVYPGIPVTRNVTVNGNYVGVCINGPIERYSAGIFYDINPLKAIISLTASPRSIKKDSKSIIKWSIQNPPLASATPFQTLCSITAKAVCSNGACTTEQTNTENSVKSILATEMIDAGGQTITDSVRGTTPVNGRAVGSKVFSLTNSIDFTITCGHATGPVKASVRVMVTKNNER